MLALQCSSFVVPLSFIGYIIAGYFHTATGVVLELMEFHPFAGYIGFSEL